MSALSSLVLVLCLAHGPAAQEPPQAAPRAMLRTHVEHDGRPLEGRARIKLAITRGARQVWSHDGTGDPERAPEGALSVAIEHGELELELGAEPQVPLPQELFDAPGGALLHLWVESDGRFLRCPTPLPFGASAPAAAASGLERSDAVLEERLEREREGDEDDDEPKNPGERERFRRQQRLDDRGGIAADALLEARRQLDQMPVLQPGDGLNKDASLWSWSWLGPGNVGGRIRSILTHPGQPSTLFIGSVGGGIWRSLAAGLSWAPMDDFMPSLAVSSLAMRPGTPSVLYAATGEGFGNYDGLPGAGIFRSADGGLTWGHLATTNPAGDESWRWVNRLATHPTQPDWLFAITSDGRVWRSMDQGSGFTQVLATGQGGRDIKVHPSLGQYVAVGTTGGVWTSAGSGAAGTWTFQSTGAAGKLPSGGGRAELAFAAGTPVTIYASIDRNKGEIWRSTDAGATWSLRSTGFQYLGNQGWYNNTIWVDPLLSDRIVFGGIDLWRSTSGGASPVRISDWSLYHIGGLSAHGDNHAIVPHAQYDGFFNTTVYVGNDGGIQRADDIWSVIPTSGWTNLANGLGITQFLGGAAAPDGSRIIGGTQDNDTLRYLPSGGANGWYQAETGDGGACAIDYQSPSRLYSEYTELLIEKSTDGGNTYASAVSGLTDAGNCCNAVFIASFRLDPNDPHFLVAGGTSVWRATNYASSWSAIRGPITDGTWSSGKCDPPGAPTTCANAQNPRVTALAIAKGDSGVIWAGYESGRVSRTLDGGSVWANVDSNLPDRFVTSIAIHPWDKNQVFVTFGGYQQQSIWYTPDGGQTWADRTGTAPYTLPAVQLNSVVFHPAQPNWVYVGTDLGVLASEDLGVTWSKLPLIPGVGHEGPVNTEVAELFWQGGQHLIAATHGRGMYRATPFAVLYVDRLHVGAEQGTFELPFKTVAAAQAAATPGSVIAIKGETYPEAPLTFTSSGTLQAVGGVVIIR